MNETEAFQKLTEYLEKNPEVSKLARKEHPDWFTPVFDWAGKYRLIEKAHENSPEGYCAYYEGKYGFAPPWQVKRWVEKIYRGHSEGLGFTLNGYRGSWKTVSISVTFLEHRIGLEPYKTNLVIRASDTTADEVTGKITATIRFHPWWKLCFPNIVPDEEARWSTNGYWVIDNSKSHEEWTELMAGSVDPTLIGGGYTSQKINGKHPSGVCLTDDLHGLNNSFSDTERKAVVRFYTTELAKTFVRKDGKLVTWPINVGVPWGNDDVHRTLAVSGGYLSDTIPVMKPASEDDPGAVYIDGVNELTGAKYDDIVGWWVLANPNNFDVDQIKRDRGLGKFDFWQMMMMDLTSAKSGSIRHYPYPRNEIDPAWPMVGGVDVPYDFQERYERESKLSSFSMTHLAKNPRGGAVVAGGVLGHPSIKQAFDHILDAQSNFANWVYTLCEDVGGGKVFRSAAKLMYPHMKILGSDLGKMVRLPGEKGGKAKNKKTRIQTELIPWIENGVIRISDERSALLDALRDGLDNFSELDERRADERLDALDSLYHAAKGMPEVLAGKYYGEKLPSVIKKKKYDPLEGRLAARQR